jgi:hypothetical protein
MPLLVQMKRRTGFLVMLTQQLNVEEEEDITESTVTTTVAAQ